MQEYSHVSLGACRQSSSEIEAVLSYLVGSAGQAAWSLLVRGGTIGDSVGQEEEQRGTIDKRDIDDGGSATMAETSSRRAQ